MGYVYRRAQNEHSKLQRSGFNRADGVVQAESHFRRATEKKWQVGRQEIPEAPLPRTPRKTGKGDGMGNEVQHPMAEHQEADNHSCTMISIGACSQESGDQRPDDRHEEAVRPRDSCLDTLNTCEGKSDG